MANNTTSKKPENWGPRPQARLMSVENADPNRARIEAKTAEMKTALETKYKK